MPEIPTDNFMEQLKKTWVHPLDLMICASKKEVNPISPNVAVDFALGCQAIYFMLRQVDPDLVIYPLRGAKPISWALETIEKDHGEEYRRLFLRIGQHVNVDTGKESGLPKPRQNEESAKKGVIRQDLLNYRQMLVHADRLDNNPPNNPQVTKPVLIDEVMSGATLTEAAKVLGEELREVFGTERLYIVAAQDSRGKEKRPKIEGYKTLLANDSTNYQVATVNLPLFYIDRRDFLDYLVEPNIADDKTRLNMTHIMHNTEAEQLIKFLVSSALHPQQLRQVLDNVNNKADDFNPQALLIREKLKLILASREGSTKKVSEQDIINWLKEFATIATTYQLSIRPHSSAID